jgi:hypothetical protein
MRETYAAMGGTSEMLPSAQSSFVRILMVLHESAGLCFWISAPVGFYNELVLELVRGSTLYNVSLWKPEEMDIVDKFFFNIWFCLGRLLVQADQYETKDKLLAVLALLPKPVLPTKS